MSEQLNTLFNEKVVDENSSSKRRLDGSAQLAHIAGLLANTSLKTIDADFEKYKDAVAASKTDNKSMDELLSDLISYDDVPDTDFIKELDDDTIEGILKSQQSKRSRCKKNTMTMDNYRAMMIASISENIVRHLTGRIKNSVGNRRSSGEIGYTDEELLMYSKDQNALRRELRNLQSKKSIEKRKDDFNEEDERYQAILEAIDQLKARRIAGDFTTPDAIDITRDKLSDILDEVDIKSLKAAEAKALLEEIFKLTTTEELSEELSESDTQAE